MNAVAAGNDKAGFLRAATPADDSFLLELFADTTGAEFGQLPEQQRVPLLRMQHVAREQQYAAQWPAADHQIICDPSGPIGRLLTAESTDQIRLIDIALLTEHRGRGIGGMLIRELIDRGRARAVPVTAHVLRGNPALRLYQRLGFDVVAEDEVYLTIEARC